MGNHWFIIGEFMGFNGILWDFIVMNGNFNNNNSSSSNNSNRETNEDYHLGISGNLTLCRCDKVPLKVALIW